ncbi:dihydroxy-acid dehydratase [Castellaniella sp. GW247-6E4]|uniref:dihydroxy-acid dehydratase domain-containing protein n=1 Tax=Castellaniella sp. GW247-6E4 TaxID=3140380 RepID=UPI0033146685
MNPPDQSPKATAADAPPTQLLDDMVRAFQWSGLDAGADTHPRVGIISSYAGTAVCFPHVPDIARIVADEVTGNGGLGLVIPTSAPCDSLYFANRQAGRLATSLDRLVADIEDATRGVGIDALVFLPSCDTTVPAHLITAARLNLPTVFLPCGYQRPGQFAGRRIDLIDVYEGVGAAMAGRMPRETLEAMAGACATGPGVCPGLGTATTLHMACEALGLTPLGHSPIAGASPRLRDQAKAIARTILEVSRRNLRARDILSVPALTDAIRLVLAIGGAPSSLGFLQRLSDELRLRNPDGTTFDVRRTAEHLADSTRQICFVAPCGPVPVDDLERSGGARQVLKRLATELHAARPTVSADTLGEALSHAPPADGPAFDPPGHGPREAGLIILRGSLAPGGGIVRPAGTGTQLRQFKGSAMVLDNASQAYDALARKAIPAGSVLVVRGAGLDDFGCALHGAGLSDSVALVSDGGHSGLSRSLAVSFIRPAAVEGGPIGKVANGDQISIDLDARSVTWN